MYGLPIKYIGQRGQAFHTRYKDQKQKIKDSNGNSGY
jgi:hypothetical protein